LILLLDCGSLTAVCHLFFTTFALLPETKVTKIFINEETRRNLVNFFRYLNREEPNEIRKLSVNNYQVYLSVQEEETKRNIQNYDQHIFNEIDANLAFQGYRSKMLDMIEDFHQERCTSSITKAWDALRDPIVFRDPIAYMDNLRKSQLFPSDFIESLFYHKLEQQKFTPHLALVEEAGRKFWVISDSINGEREYPYRQRLYPDYLEINSRGYGEVEHEVASTNPSTDKIYHMYRKLLPQPAVFGIYIPRPQFFYDVLYPSLTEYFTECWIQDVIFSGKDWSDIKSIYGLEPLLDFDKYNRLYERFDLYFTRGSTLFCIDVKAWSLISGNRLSKRTLEKTENKLDTIKSDYPEFHEVKGLLLNLHAPQEKSHRFSSSLFSGNLIFFDDYRFPVESNILREFLFH
jgi:hypothetical protein